MTKIETLEWIKRSKIVPVVRANSSEQAFKIVGGLLEGGIDVLEITMTVPGAIEVVQEVALLHGSRILIGAGTVLDAQTAEACIEAGAQFIVSPALNEATVKVCNALAVACAPGALTPTEVVRAYEAGGDLVKVFPCDALGGPTYLKSLRAPLPHIPLMPTGGVTLDTIKAFLQAGAVAVGVGSSLVDPQLSHSELIARARAFRAAALD